MKTGHHIRKFSVAGRSLRAMWPFFLGLLLCGVIFRDVAFLGTRTFFASWDASVQTYAWNTATGHALHAFSLKFWDFSVASGTSFVGEMQPGALYPIGWIWALLSPEGSVRAMEFRILFHYALAFGFAYHLFRLNSASVAGGLVGALVFAFMGSVALRASGQPNIFEGLVYMPAVIYCAQRAFISTLTPWRDPWCGLGGLSMGLMVMAGHLQPPVHTAFMLGIMAAFYAFSNFRRGLHVAGVLLFMALVAMAISLPQLISLVEYMNQCCRWIGAAEPTRPPHAIPYSIYGFSYVLSFGELASIVDPSITPKEACTLFFGQAPLVLLILALVLKGSPRKWMFLTVALCAVFIAMGDNTVLGRLSYRIPLLNGIREPIRILCAYQLCVAALAAMGLSALERVASNRAVRLLAISLAGLLVFIESADYAKRLTSPVGTANDPRLYYHQDAALMDVLRHTVVDDSGPSRYYAFPNELLPPNLGDVAPVHSLRSHRATMQSNYYDELNKDWDPRGESFRRLGLRYYIAKRPLDGWPVLLRVGDLYVQERLDYLGIFYLLQQDKPIRLQVEKVQWSENSVSFRLKNPASGRLVFAQPRYPGWKVYVDGRGRSLSSSGILTAVDIGPSDKAVEFAYRPWWLWPSMLIAALASVWVLVHVFGLGAASKAEQVGAAC